jgi:hypothetical protein
MLENVAPFSHLRGTPLIWSITLCSASAFLLFGYDQGVLGGLTTQPTFLDAMGVRAIVIASKIHLLIRGLETHSHPAGSDCCHL